MRSKLFYETLISNHDGFNLTSTHKKDNPALGGGMATAVLRMDVERLYMAN
jgi:hypothetical protein